MNKLLKCQQDGPEDPEYMFYCPGCDCHHWFKTTGDQPRWTWNDNMAAPTVRASILNRGGHFTLSGGQRHGICCHLYITDGKIKYLNDCNHKLAGQTITMQNE